MPLNKVIFNNNSQNNNTFLKKGTPEGPKPVEENVNIPIVQADQPQQEIIATVSIAVPTIPIGSRPNVLRPNISKNEGSVKYTSPTSNKNKFTSKLLNYVEPYEVGGVRKTAFYSEISTNFKVGERVYIINGNYDSHDKILNDKYSKGSDGYKVLLIEDCKVVLDVDYTGVNPYESPLDINDLIFVHNIDYTATNYVSSYSEPFNYISTFKTYVTDTTIPGDLVSLFQGKVVSNVLRTWTGNIIFNKFAQSKNTTDVDFLDNHTGAFTPPGSIPGGAFFVRDSLSSPVTGNWIDVSTQIRTNQIRLMDTLSNPTNEIGNKRLFILGEDFTWEGTNFQERQIYKFDKTTSKWVIDRQYKIPIITATYFKYGKFVGEHNGGLFGTYLKSNKWQNATWNYGVMINSDWNNGLMNTNTKVGDGVVRASLLYDQFSIPYVSQVIDTTNNSGLGYNLVIDSKIIKGVFIQSTFENCNIKGSSIPTVPNYYSKTTQNYDITANFSKFKFCDLESVILSSSTLADSIVENSNLKRTKAVNSQIFNSVFDSGEFNSDSGIRILGAELNSWDPQLGNFADNSQMVGILKLFISDEDFFRMEKNDTFYIERVNKEFFLGTLDADNRIILPYETKYLLNLYWDAEFTSKVGSKQAVSVRDKRSNRNRFYISRSTSAQFQTKEVPNTTQINGITWWTDVTARFSSQANRLSPAYDSSWTPTPAEVAAGTWFYYLYEIPQQVAPPIRGGQGLIELPAFEEVIIAVPVDQIGGPVSIYGYGQTLHIFKYISVPTLQDPILATDGYTPLNAEAYERVFSNTTGPFDSLSRGQFRGEYSTDIQSFLINQTTPIYGANSYQINDVVRIYNPQTEKWEYYQCLVPHNPQLTPDSYVTRQYTIGGANQKVLASETSKYYNYCSIDIETRALGWYRDVQLNKDVYTFDRDQTTITMPLKPKMDNLLPTNIVDKIFKNVLLKNSNFHSGVFVNSNWVSGSLIEDFELVIYNRSTIASEVTGGVKFGAKLVMSRQQPGVSPLSSNFNIFTKFNQLRGNASWFNPAIKLPQLGEVIHINSITYQSPTQRVELEGQYVNGVQNLLGGLPYYNLGRPTWGTSPLVSISENVSSPNSPMSSFLTNVGTYSIIGSETVNYASMHRVVIENSTVYSGVFKRVYFKNTKLTNRVPYVKPSTFDIDPTSLPKVVNVVFARNNSLVENGFIYQSHITNITNTGGYFHSCYWNGATFSNGEFQSGYWLNGTFLNGKFSDSNSLTWYYITPIFGTEQVYQTNDETNEGSVNPYISAINYFDIAKKPIRRIWNDGKFLSGEFYNSYWVDGTFSNGKFWRSKWFAGDFESGIFGDQSIKYEETTFGYGWYSPFPVGGINWLPTIYAVNGFGFIPEFLGRTQSKFFGGVVQNGLVGGNGVVFWYNGQMSAGEFTSASASSNMQSIWYNGTFYGSVFGNYAQWKNGIFNSGKFISIYGSEEQTFVTRPQNTTVFSWESGVFNGGEFGTGELINNSIWGSGEFNDGIFRGRLWRNGVFSGGNFMGSVPNYPSGIPSNEDNTIEKDIYLSFAPFRDPNSFNLANGDDIRGLFYGLWVDGVVTEKKSLYVTNEKVVSKIKRAIKTTDRKSRVNFQNVVWIDGLYDYENSTFKNSLFCKGTFSNGTFDGGVFNPYVDRDYLYSTASSAFYFEPNLIKWERGVFVTGSFYAAEWQNGLFKNGYMSGAYWKNGIWEYGNADNIFWDGGTWRNGNWNGSPFNHLVVATGPANPGEVGYSHSVARGREFDIILRTDRFMRESYPQTFKTAESNDTSYIFVSNVFSASPYSFNFGVESPNALRLRDSEYHEIYFPYAVKTNASPAVLAFTDVRTALTTNPLTFWLSGQSFNFFTMSGQSGANDSTWEFTRSQKFGWLGGSDFTYNPSVGTPIATIPAGSVTSTTTPTQFCTIVEGLTFGGLFYVTGLPYNFKGKAGVKLRFYNYRNNPTWPIYNPSTTIQAYLTISSVENSLGYILDLNKSAEFIRGWATGSHFTEGNAIVEHNVPGDPAKPLTETYEALDYVPVVQYGNSAIVKNFETSIKACSDWDQSLNIPFYWNGTYDASTGLPNLITFDTTTQNRNPVNLYTKFSDYGNLPIPEPSDSRTINSSPRGYNTYPKRYLGESQINIPEDNVQSGAPVSGGASGLIPNSSPSHKIYARWLSYASINAAKGYSMAQFDTLISQINAAIATTSQKPFNGVTGSRIGIYFYNMDIAGFPREFSREVGLPTTAIAGTDDEKRDQAIELIREIGISGFPWYSPTENRYVVINVGSQYYGQGVSVTAGWDFGSSASVTPNLSGFLSVNFGISPNGTDIASFPTGVQRQFDVRRAYYFALGGVDIYQGYGYQYYTEMEVSVELTDTVSFEVWMAGASYSTYDLKSKKANYSAEGVPRESFFPAFYRLKFNYITTPEVLNNPDPDRNRFWVRKTSFGILRIYSWRVTRRKIEYNFDFNNALYSGVDQTKKFIGIPATPSVVLSLPTGFDRQNSIVFGNGVFRQGVWENGVWNGGYRFNSSSFGFFEVDDLLKANDILFAIRKTSRDTLWSIKIQLVDSLSAYQLKLDVGQKISVSNLAAYDNNDRRIYISGVLDVESYSLEENTLTVTYKSLTPISYIKKDSSNHLIYITTNVWTNGAFLNGVFRGVWNNGLFKGTPVLTEMIDSHFIDGAFEGGHFKSVEKKANSTIYQRHNTGLIQNFRFKDLNNPAPNRKWESTVAEDITNRYLSWIDVVYSTQSKVNLKLDTTQLRVSDFIPMMIGSEKADAAYFQEYEDKPLVDLVTGATSVNPNVGGWKPRTTSTVFNAPNLQGYPTLDVLSSVSEFRDFLTTTKRTYNLGTKRKVFSNLLANDGNFIKPISSNATFSRQLGSVATTLTSIGFTFSTLWQRVGSEYVPPGYAGSAPKTWYINQVGHGDKDKPLTYEPREIVVTSGDIIEFRMNDLRKPALKWSGTPGVANGTYPTWLKARGRNGGSGVQEFQVNQPMGYYKNACYPFNDYSNNGAYYNPGVTTPFGYFGGTPYPYPLASFIYAVANQINGLGGGWNNNGHEYFGWNAFNNNQGARFGGPARWIPRGFSAVGYGGTSAPLGNRIQLTTGWQSITPYGDIKFDTDVLGWAFTDAGYDYPQSRSINTATGERSSFTGLPPIQTNQTTGRTGPGPYSAPKTPGLTHGVHFYQNLMRLAPTNLIYGDWSEFNASGLYDAGGSVQQWVSYFKDQLNRAGLNGERRYNPTEFNPYNAYGKITVLPIPEPVWTKNLPANYSYDSNTDSANDNILKLTISDYVETFAPTFSPLNWIQILQNKNIKPVPNRYYELSVDITYNLKVNYAPTPPQLDGFYQGLFLDDIFGYLDQQSDNLGLPQKNLHQYMNHFYNGEIVAQTNLPGQPLPNPKVRVRSTEYFMNKTNLDITFFNSFPVRGGPLSIDISNISLNEVNMLPFFSYFSASVFDTNSFLAAGENPDPSKILGRAPYIPTQIDFSPRIPQEGRAPFVELSNNNFSFTDNFEISISSKFISKSSEAVFDLTTTSQLSDSDFLKASGQVATEDPGGGGPGPGG